MRLPGTRVLRIAVADVQQFIERDSELDEMAEDQELIEGDPAVDKLADDLASWLSKRDVDMESELCPRCAVRPIADTSERGWCGNCETEVAIALDETNERERARKRRWWEENGSEWRAATRTNEKKPATTRTKRKKTADA